MKKKQQPNEELDPNRVRQILKCADCKKVKCKKHGK